MAKLELIKKTTDGIGAVIWHYSDGRRVRRVPAAHSSIGKAEYFAEWLPSTASCSTAYIPPTASPTRGAG